MDGNRPGNQIWKTKIKEKRGQKSPNVEWGNLVEKILSKKHTMVKKAKIRVRYRKQWVKFVHG